MYRSPLYRWLLGLATLALGIAALVGVLSPVDPGQSSGNGGETDASSTPASPGAFAPAGTLVAKSDRVPGAVLQLLLRSIDGKEQLCTVGPGPTGEQLASLRCTEDSAPIGRFKRAQDGDEIAGLRPRARADSGGQTVEGDHGPADRLVLVGANGEEVEVGPIPHSTAGFEGCTSEEADFVVANGAVVHGERRVAVTRRLRGRGDWSVPSFGDALITHYVLTCHRATLVLTYPTVDSPGVYLVHREICRSGDGSTLTCDREETTLSLPGSDPVFADLGGQILAIFTGPDGRPAGRLGEEELSVPEPPGRVLSRDLYVRGDAAILTMRTAEGLFALRISSNGRTRVLDHRAP